MKKRKNIKPLQKKEYLIPDSIKYKLSKFGKRSFVKIRRKQKHCDKKRGAWYTAQEANLRLIEILAKNPDLYLRAYKCDFCKKYHLTSQTEEENAERIQMFNEFTDMNIIKKQSTLLRQNSQLDLIDLYIGIYIIYLK